MKSKRLLIGTISVTLFTVFIMLNSCTKEKVETVVQKQTQANPYSTLRGEPGGPLVHVNFDKLGKWYLSFDTRHAFDSIVDLLFINRENVTFLNNWEKQWKGFISMRTFYDHLENVSDDVEIPLPSQSLATVTNHKGVIEIEGTICVMPNKDTVFAIMDGDLGTIGKILGHVPLSMMPNVKAFPVERVSLGCGGYSDVCTGVYAKRRRVKGNFEIAILDIYQRVLLWGKVRSQRHIDDVGWYSYQVNSLALKPSGEFLVLDQNCSGLPQHGFLDGHDVYNSSPDNSLYHEWANFWSLKFRIKPGPGGIHCQHYLNGDKGVGTCNTNLY